MIKRISGDSEVLPLKKKASEAFSIGDVVTKDSSGYITKATALTPRSEIIGLIMKDVASTDDDYADNSVVEIEVPCENTIYEFPVGTGTAVQAMVGKKFDLKDEDELDVNAQITKAVEITLVLSTSIVRGKFRIHDSEKARYVTYQQAIAFGDFTDGTSTSGTLALTTSIPAGAVFVQSIITSIVGFTGDTSAVIIIGDGTDTDRYMTGTPSVFTTATAGVDLGVPSGTKWHTDAKTPTVTITSGSDWGAVVAGSALITLIWIEVD
jgi:hypothetical protein